jgi:nitrate reductase / nitrite oxidoreductase, beta subunit
MKIKSQVAMVLNLDKCIGCHTCSIPCKNVWTNRSGAEYMWFNNVETKPGIGYPKHWEDQGRYRGGWILKDGKPALRSGGRLTKLARIFNNPDLPSLDNYYEPWTYDYEKLASSPARRHQPSVRAKSLLTGENMAVRWGPNWEDDLAGVNVTGKEDVNFRGLEETAYLNFERVFMFYIPRLCEHCLNPSCVASCPSGAMYKRDEDGIVLVDQERCRGWRFCVSGCPYKKVYFNWRTGRSEKCIFCFPRTEAGLTTLCAETCVGRIRYVGVMLYDADRLLWAASAENDDQIYSRHLSLFLDPFDPAVQSEAVGSGISQNFLDAAKASPVYKLAVEWKLALPLHPEYRTLPMIWYIPPLSPFLSAWRDEAEPAADRMRIPVQYLANVLAAGNEAPVRGSLNKLMALRAWARSVRVEGRHDQNALAEAGLNAAMAEEIYRLLSLARYGERNVVPGVRREASEGIHAAQGRSGLFFEREE